MLEPHKIHVIIVDFLRVKCPFYAFLDLPILSLTTA